MGLNPFASQGLVNENSYLNLTENKYNTDSTNRLTILYNTKIGTYYAVNSAEDFSSQLVPAPSSVKTQAGVVIPSRSTVTNNYNQFLDNKTFDPSNTDGYSTTDAISRVNYDNSYSVYFLYFQIVFLHLS